MIEITALLQSPPKDEFDAEEVTRRYHRGNSGYQLLTCRY
jgi:hypothetical protein